MASRFSSVAFRGVMAASSRTAPRFVAPAVTVAARRASTFAASATASRTAFGARALGAAAVLGASAMVATTGTVYAAKVDYKAVRDAVAELMDQEDYDDGSLGPVLVRLAWHSSGTYDQFSKTGGSNGATMRFKPECEHGANAGLHVARQALEKVKEKFPGITYADLYTLAGVVAVEEMGGPTINWSAGRTDADSGKACPPDGRLPDAARQEDHVRAIFYRMGFSDREIVALVGAHALGRCHSDRSGFDGPWTHSPTTFSNEFFRLLLDETWTERKWNGPKQYENGAKDIMMTPADLSIRDDPDFRKIAEEYKNDEEAFFKDFAAAYSKLLALGVPQKRKKFLGLF